MAKLRSGEGEDDFNFSEPENIEDPDEKRKEALNKILKAKKKEKKGNKADDTAK